ncbi:OB-fold nucleic acid binding domain-containing protein [Clostridium sp. SYSU_GA19001]|uniref:3'-5' exoribonuclease YhaM family protein n=1 Tax=Clostridium caldaquaticum TaxID=2940653 RepID=UPI0020770A2F|nr:OB-fold nucleic acid binding domain-containing protein [Clostridium caldaquaticum]MCM8709678.1 OB-fold nucleic acid binding domain-containing protein [Clostridium caldaquaticum]
MEFKKIKELQVNERIDGFFIIKSLELKTSANGKKYLDLTLGDKTGDINAKIWEYAEGDEEKYIENMLVKVRGIVSSWQNSLQLKIEKIRETIPSDGVNIKDFVPVAPFDSEFMYQEIQSYVEGMKNKDIKNIVSTILEENHNKLMHYPAAKKNHHAMKGGLLYHVFTMLKAGEKLSEIYTFINTDLLYAGVILHDMAKLEEMDASELGIVSEYTVEGQLLGHIIQGIKKLEITAQKVGANKEVTMMLQHMILSHHYEPEYGSPVKPMFPEAELLHYLDIIDARMYDMNRILGDTKSGGFSEKIYSLEGRRIYKGEIACQE